MITRVVATLVLFSLVCHIKAGNDIISFEKPELPDWRVLQRAWEAIDPSVRSDIETYLLVRLGLSSTGTTSLIGVYSLSGHDALGPEGSKVLHFVQRDLFGERLFWSCLVNPQNRKVRILYQCADPDRYGSIETIKIEK